MRTPRQRRARRPASPSTASSPHRAAFVRTTTVSPRRSAILTRFSQQDWQWLALIGALSSLLVAALAGSASAQLPQTRLYALFPAGGQAGQSFDVAITRGDDLEEISQLLFTHPGIQAVAKTSMGPDGKPTPVPNQFTVTVDQAVAPGIYEVRARGLYGLSNPRMFSVGQRGEVIEVEPNNTAEQATPVEIEQTVNGRISGATDVDFFKFTGQAGQRLIFDCAAQRIDSRLDGTLEVHDSNGRRLAFGRNNFAKDAVVDVTLPANGEYFLRLTDFVYAGSDDYFYRLTLRNSAFIDFVDPPAGVAGKTSKFTLYGRNLPQGQPSEVKIDGKPLQKQVVDIALPADATHAPVALGIDSYAAGIDGFAYTLQTPKGPANTVMIGFSSSPVTPEIEPNNTPEQSQKITLPAELSGGFQVRGDLDVYEFEAKAGDSWWLEVQGQRLGTGCDPYLSIDQVVVNKEGPPTLKRITSVDDDTTNLLPIIFETVHDDPITRFTAPATGTYRVTVRDRYGASRGSPSLQYRLTIRQPQPDFRVVVLADNPQLPNQKVPQTWAAGLRRGDQFRVWALVLRQDGFTGDVEVSAEGLPPGVTCRPVSIGSNPSQGVLVFESAENAAAWAGTVKIVGKARISDPAKDSALTAAEAALKPSKDALAAAAKAAEKPLADLKLAETELQKAKEELAKKTDDAGLRKKAADAEAKFQAAKTNYDKLEAARAAAENKVKDVEQQIAAATRARDQSIHEVVRAGRAATISWSGANNIPGKSRLSDGLELSVIEELAPFQVSTEVDRVIANHNRQILVPVKAIRRDKFEADINMTFVGQPQNVQVENKPIKKGVGEEIYRIFVPPNAPEGTYVLYLAAQAQVPYSRNPQKAERLKAELEELNKTAAAAVNEQKAAAAARDNSVKAATMAQTELKKVGDAKLVAEKKLADARAAEKTATEAVAKAGEEEQAKAAAQTQLEKAQTELKAATEDLAQAEAARMAAEAAAKAADQAKIAAEMKAKAADDKVKATAAAKTAAEKRHTDAVNAAKPKNINFLPTTEPIVLTIRKAPYTLTAAPASGGKLKRGQKLEVKVTVKRQNEFEGPVTLTLAVPPKVTGLKAAPVTIPADQTEGVLAIEAAGDATEGAIANLVVRAISKYEGEAMVDQAVSVTVTK